MGVGQKLVLTFGIFVCCSASAFSPQSENQTLLRGARQASGIRVTFYDHANHEGDSFEMDLYSEAGTVNCHRFPAHWNDRVSSVNTHNNCVYIYEHGDCNGRRMRIAPGTEGHSYLGDQFNDAASSASCCGNRCG